MAGMNINVSSKALENFAQYVSDFSHYVNKDCQKLKESLKKLSISMDDDSMREISSMVNEILKIANDEESELKKLSDYIMIYASFVEKVKETASGK